MCTRRYLFATLTVATLVGCFIDITGSDRSLDVEASESFFVQLDATSHVRLKLEGINGAVKVVGDVGSSVASVAAERRVRSDTRSDAQQFLSRVTVELLEQGDEIVVRTIQPTDTGGREVIVDYDLTIPSQLEVHVVNVNGEVELRSFDSAVEVEDVNGAVAVTGCRRRRRGHARQRGHHL